MKRGLSATDAIEALGGVGLIEQNALEFINYGYGFYV